MQDPRPPPPLFFIPQANIKAAAIAEGVPVPLGRPKKPKTAGSAATGGSGSGGSALGAAGGPNVPGSAAAIAQAEADVETAMRKVGAVRSGSVPNLHAPGQFIIIFRAQ